MKHVERSSRDLSLATFDPCVNLIFPPAVLFINGCTFGFKSEKCLSEREKPAFTKSFCVCRLLRTLPKKGARFKYRLNTTNVLGRCSLRRDKGKMSCSTN